MPPQQQTRDAAAAGDMAKILPAWQKHVQGLKGLLSDRTEAKIYATLGYSTMDTDIVIERLISQVFNNEQSRFDFAVRKQQTVPAGKDNEVYEDDLVDYDEEVENDVDGAAANPFIDVVKKGYVRIRNSGFGDFLLKPELLRAI